MKFLFSGFAVLQILIALRTCEQLSERENFDALLHPHIGLSTLTLLFEGSIMHRDTLGNGVEIKPGAVNWITAGKGIVHSERTPE